jgi:predicted dehydrogenase
MYIEPLVKNFQDVAELVALCDQNSLRAQVANKRLGFELPIYTDFDEMLDKEEIDKVIVTTKDCFHHKYIIRALERGKDVISEKPMTIDAEKCRQILDAEKRTGRKVTVTFNYRFTPYTTKIKELLSQDFLGKIFSVDFHWYLDTRHGADYYRRWHAELENSGGLYVHKATHHFDLVNWFLGQEPRRVFAMAKLNFYGANRAEHGERCLTCKFKDKCEFYLDLNGDSSLKELYLDTEAADGYVRDQCVFGERINIYDTMSTLVNYSGGTQLCYSLHSYTPFEGWRMALNGEKGRLEISNAETFYRKNSPDFKERSAILTAQDPYKAALGIDKEEESDLIRFYPLYGGVEVIEVPRVRGGHGGSDERLQNMLFRGYSEDPLGHMADSWAGAMSLLIGAASNLSVKTGQPVDILDLIK